MNPTNVSNGKTDELFYPGSYGASIELDVMRPEDREAYGPG